MPVTLTSWPLPGGLESRSCFPEQIQLNDCRYPDAVCLPPAECLAFSTPHSNLGTTIHPSIAFLNQQLGCYKNFSFSPLSGQSHLLISLTWIFFLNLTITNPISDLFYFPLLTDLARVLTPLALYSSVLPQYSIQSTNFTSLCWSYLLLYLSTSPNSKFFKSRNYVLFIFTTKVPNMMLMHKRHLMDFLIKIQIYKNDTRD